MTVEDAIKSYVFNLVALGEKIPATKIGVAELETKVNEAFSGVLGDSGVRITPSRDNMNIEVNVY